MKKVISILIFTCLFLNLHSQDNELVYLKFIPVVSNDAITPFADGHGFLVPYYTNAYTPIQPDLGIFDETIINDAPNDTLYKNSIAIYDANFNFSNHLLYGTQTGSMNTVVHSTPSTFPELFLSFKPSSYAANLFTSWSNVLVEHKLTALLKADFSEESISQLYMLKYLNSYQPYTGFSHATGDGASNIGYNQNYDAFGNDSILISYYSTRKEQQLITSLDTVVFPTDTNQIQLIRVAYNIFSDEVVGIEQIGSDQGILVVYAVKPTKDNSGIYRTGMVRGNNTPVSISGNELEMTENDSLYHVYITKENVEGQTQWLTELYAYNNLLSDTLVDEPTNFEAIHIFGGFIEKDNHLFINSWQKMRGTTPDTLLYKDFTGQTFHFSSYIPWFEPGSYINKIMHSEKAVYKINPVGEIIGKLSHKNKIATYEFILNPAFTAEQTEIFEVGDKIAWINNFGQNENQGEFIYTHANGEQDTTFIDFPSGKGAYILWLDHDLNIVDHWVFPFQGAAAKGARLQSVIHMQGDSILVQGQIFSGISLDLDPFGDFPNLSSQTNGTFYAVYAAPDILSSVEEVTDKPIPLTVFPNPAQTTLYVSEIEKNTNYKVIDLSGKVVMQGSTNSSQIDINDLTPGMYLISIDTKEGKRTTKFVVE